MATKPEPSLRACLVPLLEALGNGGNVDEALRTVEVTQLGNLADFLNALAALGYTNRSSVLRLDSIEESLLPCLVELEKDRLAVLLRREDGEFFGFDGRSGSFGHIAASRAKMRVWRFFAIVSPKAEGGGQDWLWNAVGRFRRYLAVATVFSLGLGALSLLYPLLMTAMYSKLAATTDIRFILSLALGAALYLVAEAGLRFLRGALLDYSSARFGQIIGAEIFRRLLSFQASFTESAPVDSQIRRVRDFETIASFISGPAFSALFDLPFMVLNIVWLASAGPGLLIAPLFAFLVFAASTAVLYPIVKKAQGRFAVENGARHDLFARIVASRSQLSDSAARESWVARFAEKTRIAAIAGYELQRVNGLTSALASLVVALGGLATLYFGVNDIFAGRARPDALVVAMLLVWRVLEPARSAFIVVTQLDSVSKSIAQLRRFLALPLETSTLAKRGEGQVASGALAFSDVYFRYGTEGYPALAGVGFVAEPASITIVRGHEGSGKSTIAKLALGLYSPQSGRITIGGQNILQIDPSQLRRAIAFAPATAPLFPGTILANLMLGAPEADERLLGSIAGEAGLISTIEALGWCLGTRLRSDDLEKVPPRVSKLITLVRAFARRAPLLLLDDPQRSLEEGDRTRILSLLSARKEGGDTVVVFADDDAYAAVADAHLQLDGGRSIGFSRTDATISR